MIPSRFEELDDPAHVDGEGGPGGPGGSILTAPSDPPGFRGTSNAPGGASAANGRFSNRSPVWNPRQFFDVGGQSLRALQLTGRLQKAGASVRVADLFHYPTIAEMAAILAPAENARPVKGPFRGAATGVPWFHIPGSSDLSS